LTKSPGICFGNVRSSTEWGVVKVGSHLANAACLHRIQAERPDCQRIEVNMMVYANRNDVRRIHDRYSEIERQDKQRPSDPLERTESPVAPRVERISTGHPMPNGAARGIVVINGPW
jgi:hypothetical protein